MLLHQSGGSLQAALPCNSIAFTSQDGLRGPAAIPCAGIGCPPAPAARGGDGGALAEGGAGEAEGLGWGL